MNASNRSIRSILLFVLAMCVGPQFGTLADEPELLSDQSDGLLELQGESSLELNGFVGTLSLRLGKSGEIRFAARLRENRREPIAVNLWLKGNRLILNAPEDSADTPRLIEVTVPPELSVSVDLSDSVVRANGIHGDFEVVGSMLDLDARGVLGSVTAELISSKVVLVGMDRAVNLTLEECELRIDQASGPLILSQTKGRSEILTLLGDIQLDVDEGAVTGSHVDGVLEVTANRSSVDWVQFRGGANFQMTESPLIIGEGQGAIDIDTDSSVEFRSLRGPLTIRGFGADIRGIGSTALIDVETSDAEIKLDSLTGPVAIRGDALQIFVSKAKNSIKLETRSSTVQLNDVSGTIEVDNDYGDIEVAKATQKVRIDSIEGSVKVSELRAPIELRANGPEVTVNWAEIGGDQDSSVENSGGTVSLTIPQGAGGCSIEAVSTSGVIESRIPGHELDGSSSTAKVVIRSPKPQVKVSASGDIFLAPGDRTVASPAPAREPVGDQ